MAHAPLYRPHEVRFRDGTSSHKQNEHTQQVFYDLTELCNLANLQQKTLDELEQLFSIHTYFHHQRMESLTQELQELKEIVSGLQTAGNVYTKQIAANMMRTAGDGAQMEKATVDALHNIVTLPTSGSSHSKVYLHDKINDEYIVPNTLQYELIPGADGSEVIDNDFMNALTPEGNKIWLRRYRLNHNITKATCDIIITLPDDIISSRDVNTIYLHPFPLFGVNIESLEYRLNGGWQPIPGFTPVKRAGNMKYCFGALAMSQIRIRLSQETFIEEGGYNFFYLGLKDIGVFYEDYQSGVGRFEIPVSFHSKFKRKEIQGITPVYQNEKALSLHQGTRLATFKVYEVSEDGSLRYLNDTFPIPFTQNNILIKAILNVDRMTQTTPELTRIDITYKGDA
jgi:hypothetical protein